MDIQRLVEMYCDWIDFWSASAKIWTRAIWLKEESQTPKIWKVNSKIWDMYV